MVSEAGHWGEEKECRFSGGVPGETCGFNTKIICTQTTKMGSACF